MTNPSGKPGQAPSAGEGLYLYQETGRIQQTVVGQSHIDIVTLVRHEVQSKVLFLEPSTLATPPRRSLHRTYRHPIMYQPHRIAALGKYRQSSKAGSGMPPSEAPCT